MPNWSTSFQLPNVPYEKKLEHCLRILKVQRLELIPLRKEIAICKLQSARWEDLMRHWREKYEGSQEELERIKKENETLKKEKEKLEKEIEKLTKTNNRYQIALFDHGNFKHPETAKKKQKGGQTGHKDTNREAHEDYNSYQRKRIFVKTCGKCRSPIPRVNSTKQKILLDIVLHPEAVKMIIDSERQWCGTCKTEVAARDPQSLPFTEYGMNTFMMAMLLKFRCHASLSNTAKFITVGFGLKLSKSDIAAILKQAACFLEEKYEELKRAIRKGEVMYLDETGWAVRGKSAWMWIMANDQATVYHAAESRGKGIAEEMYGDSKAKAMTDGYAGYVSPIPQEKHMHCWSHILRFAHEETVKSTKDSQAVFIREELVRIYHIKKDHREYTKEKLKNILKEEFDKLLKLTSDEESFIAIQNRAKNQKEGLMKALLETEDGTNNLAERELRPLVLNRKISNGSDSYMGMEKTAIIASVVQTIARNKNEELLPVLKGYMQKGVKDKFYQYKHISYISS